MDLRVDIMVLFRQLQRCRTYGEWPKYRDTFFTSLEELVIDDGHYATDDDEDGGYSQEAGNDAPQKKTKARKKKQIRRQTADPEILHDRIEQIKEYFRANWFTTFWIRTSSTLAL